MSARVLDGVLVGVLFVVVAFSVMISADALWRWYQLRDHGAHSSPRSDLWRAHTETMAVAVDRPDPDAMGTWCGRVAEDGWHGDLVYVQPPLGCPLGFQRVVWTP